MKVDWGRTQTQALGCLHRHRPSNFQAGTGHWQRPRLPQGPEWGLKKCCRLVAASRNNNLKSGAQGHCNSQGLQGCKGHLPSLNILAYVLEKDVKTRQNCRKRVSSGMSYWHVKAHQKLLIAPVPGLEKRGLGFPPDVLWKTPKAVFGPSNILVIQSNSIER